MKHGNNVAWGESHTYTGNYNTSAQISVSVYDYDIGQGNTVSFNIYVELKLLFGINNLR